MATESVSTIKSSGGDYTSLSNWDAGEQADLVTADKIAIAECYAMEDTSAVTIDGWMTDATRYIKIYTPVAERHNGNLDASPSGYYWRNVTSGDSINLRENYVEIEGICFKGSTTSISVFLVGGELSLHHNVINGGGSWGAAVWLKDNYGSISYTAKVYNNLIVANANADGIHCYYSDPTFLIYNNTIHGQWRSVSQGGSAAPVAKNNIFYGAGCSGTFAAGTDYNATDQGSIGYTVTGSGNTHDVVSADFDFDDLANGYYHIGVDSDAKDAGVDLSSDANLAFLDDIDGDTRSGTWDIGADEYVSAAEPATQNAALLGMNF